MSFAGFHNPTINSRQGQFVENTSFPFRQSTDTFNGFHTVLQPNPQNQVDTGIRSEHNTFNGFHTNTSVHNNTSVSHDERDNFGGYHPSQNNISMNNDVLQQQYGISQSKPKYPQYAVKSVRISSYRNFPSGITQTPEELAQAGFFYSGKEDVVFCFFCGQGLRSWEPNDDVWIEHARWAPQCVHLLNCKGNDFVQMVQRAETDPEQPIQTMQNGSNAENANGHSASTNQRDLSIRRETDNSDLLNTVAAESVILNGYDRSIVLKAINVFQLKEGRSNFSATDLLTIIFGFEDGSIRYEEIVSQPKVKKQFEPKAEPQMTPQPVKKSKTPGTSKVDKAEAKTLLEENRQLKDQTICKICLEEIVSIVFLPCGHLCCCSQCAPALRKCPICRGFIKGTVKTYLT